MAPRNHAPRRNATPTLDPGSFVNVALDNHPIAGMSIPQAKNWVPTQPNTILLATVDKEHIANASVPRYGSLFLGVVNAARAGVTAQTVVYRVNGVDQQCQNYYGFLRPQELPFDQTAKPPPQLQVCCTNPNSPFLELAFVATV